MEYVIWRACERFHILPPGVEKKWNETPVWLQAMLIGYHQTRTHEENEQMSMMAKLNGVR